ADVICTPPTADFDSSVTALNVTFINQSAFPDSISWDFGDGSNLSNEWDPAHYYADTGTYNVCVTVVNSCGSDKKCMDVVVSDLKTPYCIPSANCSWGDVIKNFTFNTISNLNTSCDSSSGYINTGLSTEVYIGSSHALYIKTGVDTAIYNQGFGVWIDYNNDGDFEDTLEFVSASPSADTIWTDTITIPSIAKTGKSRMRVACRYNSAMVSSDACPALLYYGEFEDYEIVISDSAAFDTLVDFTSDITVACVGQSITFTNLTNPPAVNYEWFFGDSSSTFNPGPTKTYDSVGTYSVKLVAYASWGVDSIIKNGYITIIDTLPTANLGPDTLIDSTYTLQAGVLAASYLWSTGETSQQILVSETGAYWVEVSNTCGSFRDSVSVVKSVKIYDTPLAGEYTIGGADPDFINFNSAVDTLYALGVGGQVTFLVRDGTYEEQIDFDTTSTGNWIAGVDSINTITFQSESGNEENAILKFNAKSDTTDYTIRFNGARYITFENLTIMAINANYMRVIVFEIADHITLTGNVIQSYPSSVSGPDRAVIWSMFLSPKDNITISNNAIVAGTYAIYLRFVDNLKITGNKLTDQYEDGMYITYCPSVEISHNNITNYSGIRPIDGIYLYRCDDSIKVTHNKLLLSYGNGIAVSMSYGSTNSRGLVANNFVYCRGTGSWGDHGITVGGKYMDIYNNTVNITNTHTSACAFISGSNTDIDININNNIFTNTGGGYAYYISDPSGITSSDNNNYYSTGNFAYWGAIKNTLADLQAANAMDANSYSVDPGFVSDVNLHICNDTLNGAGIPLIPVTDDIDGSPRDPSTPDIGADEYTGFPPTPDLGSDTIVCYSHSLDATYPGAHEYTWSTGDTTMELWFDKTDDYWVIVEDACGIGSDTIHVDILKPEFVINSDSVSCYGGSDGTAEVSLSSNAIPYTYQWSNTETTVLITGLNTGTFKVTVTDSLGCINFDQVEIFEPESLIVAVTITADIKCAGESALVKVEPYGGSGTYSFLWSNGETSLVATGLQSGDWAVTATDANGCQNNHNFTLLEPAPLIINAEVYDASCSGSDGQISISVSGGTTNYLYLWSNGATSWFIDSLIEGIFITTVTDANGCLLVDSFSINTASNLVINSSISNASCSNNDGSISITVSGGTSSYQYSWSNGSTLADAVSLSAGTYLITVTDIVDTNGCPKYESYMVFMDSGCDSVWPGDANYDGIANVWDILSLGIAYGDTGSARDTISSEWKAQFANNWTNSLNNGVNYKHIDCMGDGQVGFEDLAPILLNYNQTHSKSNASKKYMPGNPDLYFEVLSGDIAPGATVELSVNLGRDTLSPNDIYGLAFSIEYDGRLIDSGSISMNYDTSWIGNTNDSSLITIDKDLYQSQKIDLGLVRTDKTPISGYGSIAKIKFVVTDNISGKLDTLKLFFNKVVVITLDGDTVPVNTLSNQVIIEDTSTSINNISKIMETIKVYPNPAQDFINISFTDHDVKQVSLYNLVGEKVYGTNSITENVVRINTSGLANGVYLLKLESDNGLIGRQTIVVQ
ncbi:MAG: hypothetical protein COC01_09850, partial [Bacteroidetes bacterium]